MFETSISKTSRLAGIIASTALAAGLAISGGGTASAQGPTGEGEVTANGGLSVRYAPSIHAKRLGAVPKGAQLTLICKVRGTTVAGNNVWYLLPPTRNEWVSARYVRIVGRAPGWCTDSNAVGENNQAVGLNLRAGPSTKDKVVGSLSANARVDLICKVKGESVRGNKLWYQTSDRKWVTARYVDNVGRAPSYC